MSTASGRTSKGLDTPIINAVKELETRLQQHCLELGMDLDGLREENEILQTRNRELQELFEVSLKNEQEASRLRQVEAELRTELTTLRTQNSEKQQEAEECQQALTYMQRSLHSHQSELQTLRESYEEQIATAARSAWETEHSMREAKEAEERAQQQVSGLQVEVLRLKSELERERAEVSRLTQLCADKDQRLVGDKVTLNRAMEEIRTAERKFLQMSEYFELAGEVVREQDFEIEKLRSPNSDWGRKVADLVADSINKETALRDQGEDYQLLEKSYEAKKAQILKAEEEHNSEKEQLFAAMKVKDDEIRRLRDAQISPGGELSSMEREIEALKSAQESTREAAYKQQIDLKAQLKAAQLECETLRDLVGRSSTFEPTDEVLNLRRQLESREKQLHKYAADLSRERAEAAQRSKQLVNDIQMFLSKFQQTEQRSAVIPPPPPKTFKTPEA